MSDPSPTDGPAAQLDPDNPWPGLDSFEERARDYFHGRDEEADELLRRVTDAPLTVLFGKSGLGKTSLLKAGLFPRLREKHFLPVHVRLDIRPEAPAFIEQIGDALRAAIAREAVDAPAFAKGETLWEFLHRADPELWSEQNYPLIPVLVLDQFEEVFTLGEHLPVKVDRFQVDLGDLAENRIPETLATRLATYAATARLLDLRAMPYKLIVTLREDFLPHLEGWRRAVPSLGRARVRLLPMRPDQALSAVYDTAPHLMGEALARRIVEFVAAAQTAETTAPAQGREIEPALLSLFCRGLNERRKALGQARFDEHLLEGAQESIIADYYRSCVEGFPDGVSRFIESELVTGKGFRNSYARDDAVPDHLTQEQLDRLIDRRLLRLEERYGTVRIELTHDVLTRAVMEQRDRRRVEEEKAALARQAEEEKAVLARRVEEEKAAAARRAEEERRVLEDQTRTQRRRIRTLVLVAVICLALAGFAAWQWQTAVSATKAAREARKAAEIEKTAAEVAQAAAETASREANTQRIVAQKAQEEAEKQAGLAETRAKEARDARQVAERQARVANARELAAFAVPMVKASDQDELAVLLGMHAVAATYAAEQTATREAEDVLRRAVGGSVKELPFPGHQDKITAIAFSPDGSQLATAAADGTLRVWNAATGDEIRRANVKGWDDLAFGPDGIRLAFTKRPGVGSAVHDVSGGSLLDVPARSRQPGFVSLSRDGRRLAVSDAGTLSVWEIATRREMKSPIGRWRGASFALNVDGTRLAVLDPDERTVHVRDVDTDGVPRSFPGDGVVKVALSPDGGLLAIAGTGVQIWNVATGEQLPGPALVRPMSAEILGITFSPPDGRYLAVAIRDLGLTLWDTASRRELPPILGRPPLAFSPDGFRLAMASEETSVAVWDIKSGNWPATLAGRSESALDAVALGSDARRVATASKDGKLRIWDATSGRSVHTLRAERNIQLLALSPSGGRVAASSGQPPGLRVWDLSAGGVARQIPVQAMRLLDLAFTDNGTRLLTAAYQGQRGLELWDIASAGAVQVPYAPGDDRRNMFAVAFSRDEKRVAAASIEETTVREVASSRGELLKIRGHWYDLVFGGRTGRWLAVSSPNRTEVWDVDTGRKVSRDPIAGAAQLKALGRRLALRDDGRLVATVDGDRRTATVWDVATGVRQSTFYRHAGNIRAIGFTPDGRQVAIVVDDWTVHYHPLTVPDLMALARTRVTSPMTSENCQKYLGRPQCPSLGR